MSILKNAIVKDSESGFFINGDFNGITYYVGMSNAGVAPLYPIEVPQREFQIDLETLTLQDINGTDETPVDLQERAALLNTYTSKKTTCS